MWPPSGSPARSAGSTLTVSPAASEPSVVRSSVSATTSNASCPPSCSTTVRQIPSMATESPRPATVCGASTRSRVPSKETTRPSSRTMPVNMRRRLRHADVRLDQQILTRGRRRQMRKLDRLRQGAEKPRPRAREHGRDEDEQLVDERCAQERSRERWPSLQQERLDALRREGAELLVKRTASNLELW